MAEPVVIVAWITLDGRMYPGTWAATTPNKPAVVMAETGASISYAELEERSVRLLNYWRAQGVLPGQVVALISDNTLTMWEVYWAALRGGLLITAINHNLAPREVEYILDDCGASAVVVSAATRDLVESLQKAPAIRLAFGGEVSGYGSYDDALAQASPQPPADQPHGDDFLYSSGTTGRPKGIKPPLPTYQVDEEGYAYPLIFGALYAIDENSVYLCPAPGYHAAPLRFGGVVHAVGGTLVMLHHFDAEAALAAIARYRVTHTQMVPTHFVRLLKLPDQVRGSYDVSGLRCVIHAAAPCPVGVKRAMIDWLGPIVEEYFASTEANGGTKISSEEWLAKPGSVGKPLLGIPHVCADDGRELPAGEVGTIFFENETEGFEYHNDPVKTAATRHPDHPLWTTVGDLGYLDEDGYLFLADRAAFMIISGGVNIYPQEIEGVFAMHPAVADIAVIGRTDEEMGQRVTAFVQPADVSVLDGDTAALQTELVGYAREQLAGFKVPRDWEFVAELPRTPTGKLVKGKLS